MALQVWLPLNGNLNNKGCSDLNAVSVQSGCGTSNDGKLGVCYKNTGTNSNVANTISFNSVAFSMCAWVRIDTLQKNWCRSFGMTGTNQYIGFGTEHSNGTSFGFHFYKTINGTNTNIFDNYVSLPTTGAWTHYSVTYDGAKYAVYVNGNLVSSNNVGVANTTAEMTHLRLFGGYGSYYAYHSLNDVRIYDHCLSIAEIKEISKGLVIHHKLSGYGIDNLLKYTHVNPTNKNLLKNNISSNWNNLTLTTIEGRDCYLYPSDQSSTWFYSGPWFKSMEANTTYTYSAWIYFTVDASFNMSSLGHFQVYNSSSSASDKSHEDVAASRIFEPTTIKANTWTRIRVTFTTNSLAGSTFQLYPRYNIAANTGNLYFRECKLEKNGTPTNWIPNSEDPEYKGLGYDSTEIPDCSGYGNHGTKTGSLTATTSTPRYDLSTTFVDNNSSITLKPYLNNAQTVNELSVSCWYRTSTMNSTAPNLWSLGENAFIRLRLASTTAIWFYARVGSSMKGYTHEIGKTLTDNTWHHVVLTFKNGVFVLYVDGVKKATDDESGTATYLTCASVGTTWHLAGYSATSEKFIGQLSDFRVYTTSISDADVLSLYNTAAKVSKNGALLGYEMKEG